VHQQHENTPHQCQLETTIRHRSRAMVKLCFFDKVLGCPSQYRISVTIVKPTNILGARS
jgi:hypothetical protein